MKGCHDCVRREFIEDYFKRDAPKVPHDGPPEVWSAYDREWSRFTAAIHLALFDWESENRQETPDESN